ncbi:MAG TPA: hypothetical protein VGR72_09285 [Candidatus Acidoferrales bacterium]|nr:hypothetical protein [Candidatus Acidoferrales bacterium]
MKPILPALAVLCVGTIALAAPPERYLHVRVDSPSSGEKVRVNIPLSLAEKVIPAIHQGPLHDGKVSVGNMDANCVDFPALVNAVKDAPDGEYVTVQDHDEDVRVAKMSGKMVVHVTDRGGDKERVEITIPWEVAQALASANGKEIDVLAAIRALENAGDTTLVTVTDNDETVRVWIDAKNTSE